MTHRSAISHGDRLGAVDSYDLALSATPTAARHYRRGVAHLLAGRLLRAQRAFEDATREDPGFAVGYASVALAQDARLNDSSRAAAQARHLSGWVATRRERQHVEVLVALVEGDPARAVALGREHLFEFPRDLVVFLVLVNTDLASRTDVTPEYFDIPKGSSMPSHSKSQQVDRCERFRSMHSTGPILQIVNAWDASSARLLAAAGAPAIGTTSFGLALAHGYPDGEQIPWETVCSVAASIIEAVEVPVTIDIEAGRGATADDVGRSVSAIIETGAVGVNIEDSVPGRPGELFAVDEQASRHAAARRASVAAGVPLFINARCDVYFGANVAPEDRCAAVLERAKAYTDAGVDGLFLPGLLDSASLATIAESVDLPVNVMVGAGAPDLESLAAAGIRRTSQGGEPFIAVLGTLKHMTDDYLAGRFGAAPDVMGSGIALLPSLIR